jgi:peptidoglycan/xylan/chitin deacetylase (PgdA/CDA1 family)
MTPEVVRPLRRLAGKLVKPLFGSVVSVDTKDPVAALTFDDGPDPVFTPRLLSVLKRYQARATFFMVGENAHRYSEIVQQVADDGHTIANHSWDHPSFPLIRAFERRAQLRRCASVLRPYGGVRLFRPPYGQQSFASRLDALWLGYTVVMFNLEVADWMARADAEWMADRMVQKIRPGSIVVLHDRITGNASDLTRIDRGPTIDAVEMTLERLGSTIRFVTVPELLRHGQPHLSLRYEPPPQDLLARLNEHPLLRERASCPRNEH